MVEHKQFKRIEIGRKKLLILKLTIREWANASSERFLTAKECGHITEYPHMECEWAKQKCITFGERTLVSNSGTSVKERCQHKNTSHTGHSTADVALIRVWSRDTTKQFYTPVSVWRKS